MGEGNSGAESWLVLKTQVAEYQQSPWLNLGFILSLAIATSTLLSILLLNHASKMEYRQANDSLSSPIAHYIVARQGLRIDISDYAELRKLGFTKLSPVLSLQETLANGRTISIKGLDLLALGLSQPDVYQVDSLMLTASYAKSLGIDLTRTVAFEQSKQIRVRSSELKLGREAITDIGTAWQVFGDKGHVSYLMVSAMSVDELVRLEQSLPEHLILQKSWSLEQRSGFAEALHLNLLALAIMAFIVSLFIAFQAANQAWNKRSELMAQLRLLGVSFGTIRFCLMLEAIFLTLVASLLGVVLALLLVSLLLPLLGATLDQLYDLRASDHFKWNWQYYLWSLAVSGAAVALALARQFIRINNAKISQYSRQVSSQTSDTNFFLLTSGLGILALIGFYFWPQNSWHQLMFKYGLLLVMATAFLPVAQYSCCILISKSHSHFRLRYIVQDAVNQVARRYLPLAAFYVALTTSIAAALMVNSFESAFVRYLEQHLNEDLYIRFHQQQRLPLATWLSRSDKVKSYYSYYRGTAQFARPDNAAINGPAGEKGRQGGSLVVNTLSSVEQFNSIVFKQLQTEHSQFAQLPRDACFINEPLALKFGLFVNERLAFWQNRLVVKCRVVGVYYDYGNPGFELTLLTDFALSQLKGMSELGYGVFINKDVEQKDIRQALKEELGISDSQIFQPDRIRIRAMDIFKQTFLLTQAIAAILISVACFGLFLSANGLELARKQELYILSSLGYDRFSLFVHMLVQWFLLAAVCVALSWPVAIWIAEALVAKVLPASFGWSMPLVMDLSSLLDTSLLGLAFLLPALYLPLRKIKLSRV